MGVVGSLGGGGFFRISPCLPADQISNAEHLILCHPPNLLGGEHGGTPSKPVHDWHQRPYQTSADCCDR